MIEEGKKQNSFSSILYRVFPYVWMAAGYLCNILYQLKYGAAYVDSDMSAEMILSNLLNNEGSIVSSNYYYSTELRVFSTQWFYRIGLWLFPDNWHAARVFGAALLVACFLLCYLYFASKAKLHRKGIFTAAALMWPFGHLFFYLALYGTYYLVYMMIALLSMGLFFSMRQGNRTGMKLVLFLLLAFASGLNGVRELLIFFVPLLAAVIIMILYRQKDRDIRKPAVYALLAVIASGAGYLINSKILSKTYTFYQTSGVTLKAADHLSDLFSVWDHFLQMFGYQSGVKLFSLAGISSVFGILLAVFFLFSLYRLLKRFATLPDTYRLTVLLMICMLVIDGMAYVFLDIVYASGFWVPILPFAFAVMQIEADTDPLFAAPLKAAGRIAFVLMITCCACSTWTHELESPYRAKKGLYETAVWLEENGYTQGYADFWNSLAVIEMSDNKVDVWTLKDMTSTEIYCWLQVKSHQTSPVGEVFLIHENSTGSVTYEKSTAVYRNEQYTVYVFANTQSLSEALTIASAAVQ